MLDLEILTLIFVLEHVLALHLLICLDLEMIVFHIAQMVLMQILIQVHACVSLIAPTIQALEEEIYMEIPQPALANQNVLHLVHGQIIKLVIAKLIVQPSQYQLTPKILIWNVLYQQTVQHLQAWLSVITQQELVWVTAQITNLVIQTVEIVLLNALNWL